MGTADTVPQIQDIQLNTQENNIIEEEDEEYNGKTPLMRHYPLRESRRTINYKGVLGICNQAETLLHQDEISQRAIDFSLESTFYQSSAFFKISKETFLSNDNTMEDIHLCAYLMQLQEHGSDTPTYEDVFRSSEEEQRQWEISMEREMTSLRKMNSFVVVDKPKGVNILDSIWALRRSGIQMAS